MPFFFFFQCQCLNKLFPLLFSTPLPFFILYQKYFQLFLWNNFLYHFSLKTSIEKYAFTVWWWCWWWLLLTKRCMATGIAYLPAGKLTCFLSFVLGLFFQNVFFYCFFFFSCCHSTLYLLVTFLSLWLIFFYILALFLFVPSFFFIS